MTHTLIQSNLKKMIEGSIKETFMIIRPQVSKEVQKTPLPNPEFLNVTNYGSSFLTELIPNNCPSCGSNIGIHLKDISSLALQGNHSFNEIATMFNLNACCRLRILSPFLINVVNGDLDVLQNENDNEHLDYPDFNLN